MNVVIPLSGTELAVSDEMRAKAFWLIRKSSSLTHIRRMYQLYSVFIQRWEEHARSVGQTGRRSAKAYRELFRDLYMHAEHLERGLDRIEDGELHGYADVAVGVEIGGYLSDNRRWEGGGLLRETGFNGRRPATGLYRWADRANTMAFQTRWTLTATWNFHRLFLDPLFERTVFPQRLAPLPSPSSEIIGPRHRVPTSGVWLPVDVADACPNYLIGDQPARPSAQVAVERIEYSTGDPALRTMYDYGERPTRWQLVWEDDRYADGRRPDESEYLDESTADPIDDGQPLFQEPDI